MPTKRIPPDDEIQMMASALFPFYKRGESIRPFLRRNQSLIRDIVRDESWATFALILMQLGIKYSTGTPWTARTLHHEFIHAIAPSKRQAKRHVTTAEKPALQPQIHAEYSAVATEGNHAGHPQPTPRFKPFSLKAQEPPRPLTQGEIEDREANRIRMFGK